MALAESGGRSLVDRMRGAAMLDVPTYEDVEADTNATGQAAVVVGLVAVASAIGGLGAGGRGVISAIISAYVFWLAAAGVVYVIGTRVFGGTATWGELLRTMGFAESPGVLRVLGIIPILGGFVQLIVAIWLLVTMVVAIRQALDFGTGKAIGTAVLAWLAGIVLSVVIAALFGIHLL